MEEPAISVGLDGPDPDPAPIQRRDEDTVSLLANVIGREPGLLELLDRVPDTLGIRGPEPYWRFVDIGPTTQGQ